MKTTRIALALLLAAGLAGCGSNTLGPSTLNASSASADIAKAESVELDSMNTSGQLDELDDAALEDLDPSAAVTSDYETQFLGLGTTKCGYVRSTEDGKFFLQSKQGFWKSKDVSYTLVASKDLLTLKVAKLLNDRVLVRGSITGTTFTVKAIYDVPDMSVLLDLCRTGCVKGKVYSAKTLVALGGAAVTLRSVDNSRIYRATSKKDGSYHVSRLAPGDYTVEVTEAGYTRGTLAKVTVAKRKSTSGNVPLVPSDASN